MTHQLSVLAIGKTARLSAILKALRSSSRLKDLFVFSEVQNSDFRSGVTEFEMGDSTDRAKVREFARRVSPDFAIIGPEEPLAAGVADELAELGIPSVGPTQALARIESSKSFARALLAEYKIDGNPNFRAFSDINGLREYLEELQEFVVKPDGLTGGKGVRVWGDHFDSIDEGEAYCREILESGGNFVIEEKLDGEEFSFQSFCDGWHVADTIPVQDHKRQGEGDTGPNTGGMGSYSCANHLLPFLTKTDVEAASRINLAVAAALRDKLNEPYKGILYGGFIKTRKGIRVIEYNARFGDPEAQNVLSILKTDFIDICEAIINGTLNEVRVEFERKSTVCKYLVPIGYPDAAGQNEEIRIPDFADERLRIYQGAIREDKKGRLVLTGSRALAVLGMGDTLDEAESVAECAASQIEGPVFHRRDIGTAALLQKRIDHMNHVLSQGARKQKATPEFALAGVG